MANEAVLIMESSLPMNMTCADGTGIEQGSVLKLTDPMTASLSDGDADYVAGICHTEKVADDGTTSVSVYRDGIFRMYLSGSVTAGQSVATHSSTAGANYVAQGTTKPFGIALETGTDGEQILIELNFGAQT